MPKIIYWNLTGAMELKPLIYYNNISTIYGFDHTIVDMIIENGMIPGNLNRYILNKYNNYV